MKAILKAKSGIEVTTFEKIVHDWRCPAVEKVVGGAMVVMKAALDFLGYDKDYKLT